MIALNHIIHRIFFRIVYWYISTIDRKGEVLFMNYGYSDANFHIPLHPSDEKNRYSIQLYHIVACEVDLEGKDILEVGSGRGGGLNYICNTFNPISATGVDLSEKAIQFCKSSYANQRIRFFVSDAEHLIFNDSNFDVVINIESSHGYPHIDKFLEEVYRVLRPGGFFIFADFRPKADLKSLDQLFVKAKLSFMNKKIITQQVLQSLDLMKSLRQEQIRNMIPGILRGISRRFVALEGTMMYNNFLTHEFEYVLYTLKK